MLSTVIISYYKAPNNLSLILNALNRQSDGAFEVIVSEDDNNTDTVKFLEANSNRYKYQITHINQPADKGFRKNEMLNRAILTSKTEYLIFIDGDCIPHKHFVKNYNRAFKDGYIFEGRSVMLGSSISLSIINSLSLKRLHLLRIIFSDTKKKKDGIYFPLFPLSNKSHGRGLLGRNWGIAKKYLLEINGFDMDYIHAGVGEDVDIEWRLKAIGLKSQTMKNRSIVYHLYHERTYSEDNVKQNYEILNTKKVQNRVFCLNGLKSIVLKS